MSDDIQTQEGQNNEQEQETAKIENEAGPNTQDELFEDIHKEDERPAEQNRAIAESILFMQVKPLPFDKLADFMMTTKKRAREAVELLRQHYDTIGSGLQVNYLANGVQLSTRPDYREFIERAFKVPPKQRLTKTMLEVLAIVAYRQPITRVEIEEVRGHSCGQYLKALMEKNFIEYAGRKEVPGNPFLYKTTQDFLNYFGFKALKELPDLKEIKELDLE